LRSDGYEKERAGLGSKFLETVEKMVNVIAENPERFAIIHRDVQGLDAGVLTIAILTLVTATSIAALIPARRAASIDPAHSMRAD
jgi:ABC-type lipoprotein release transport system permease subunit